MAEALKAERQYVKEKVSDLASHEDFSVLVDAFIWLIQEDKKQNPELYKLTKEYEQ